LEIDYGVVPFDLILQIWGAKRRKEIRGSKRKLHTEEVPNYSFSQNIIRIVKSAIMRWAEHVTRVEYTR
jgi:hypothetical protein